MLSAPKGTLPLHAVCYFSYSLFQLQWQDPCAVCYGHLVCILGKSLYFRMHSERYQCEYILTAYWGVFYLCRCFLSSSWGPAQSPACSGILEAVIVWLCEIHSTDVTMQSKSLQVAEDFELLCQDWPFGAKQLQSHEGDQPSTPWDQPENSDPVANIPCLV